MKFEEGTYRQQVNRLREMAHVTLKSYPLKNYKLKFIHHGENATFKVLTAKQDYLLRIHRSGYQTKESIGEELKWLNHINRKSLVKVQTPIKGLNNKLVQTIQTDRVGKRFVDLLSWEKGSIKYKKSENDFHKIGVMMANLHKCPIKSKHRQNWDAYGLIGGDKATFGSLKLISKDFPKQYRKLEACRKEVFTELKRYQNRKTSRLSLIHADLHFGNLIWSKNGITPIDFDDCGYGLQMYDLSVNFYNSTNFFKRVGKRQAQKYKMSLIEGYASRGDILESDIEIIPNLIRAREILMVSWLYERRDHPVIAEYFRKSISKIATRVQKYSNYRL